MKRLKRILLIILIIVIGWMLFRSYDRFHYGINKSIKLSEMNLIHVDQFGNFYGTYIESNELFSDAKTYFIKVLPDKTVDFALALKNDSQQVKQVEVDDQKRIYVHYINYHYDMIRIQSEEIIMYHANGKKDKGIRKLVYDYKMNTQDNFIDQPLIVAFARSEAAIKVLETSIEELLNYDKDIVDTIELKNPCYEVGLIKEIALGKKDLDVYIKTYCIDEQHNVIVESINVDNISDRHIENIILPKHIQPLKVIGVNSNRMMLLTENSGLYDLSMSGQIKEADYKEILTNVSVNKGHVYLRSDTFNGYQLIDMDQHIASSPIDLSLDDTYVIGDNNIIYVQKPNIKNEITTYKYMNGKLVSIDQSIGVSEGYFWWQVIYINGMLLVIALMIVLLYLYYRDVLHYKLSIFLKQSLLMLFVFSVFAISLMGLIELIIKRQAEHMHGDVLDAFEAVIESKLNDGHLDDYILKAGELSRIQVHDFNLINQVTDSSEKDVLIDHLVDYLESLNYDVEGMTLEEIALYVAWLYEANAAQINYFTKEQEDILKHVGIESDACFVSLFRLNLDGDQIIQADLIHNLDDAETMIQPRDVEHFIGNEKEQNKYLEKHVVSGVSSDNKWLRSGILISPDDEQLFIFRVGMNTRGYHNTIVLKYLNALESTMHFMIIIAVLLLLIAIRINLKKVKVLTAFVNGIEDYEEAASLNLKSRDEVGDLSYAFNDLLKNINIKFNEQKKIYKTYAKYVPKVYEKYINKSILDMKLGDFCEEEMSILYFHVHDMFEVIEAFGNQKQAFHFIKNYLENISKIIQQHDGVVTSYGDGGIVAIFEKNKKCIVASEAIISSINMLNDANEIQLKVGIGLNRGQLLLGLVGEANRMQFSIISKQLNIAHELAMQTITHRACILATQNVVSGKMNKKNEAIRYIGLIQPANTEEAVQVYDLFSSDVLEELNSKAETKAKFEHGIMLYQKGEFMKARSEFRQVIEENHQDKAAQHYYFLADQFKLKKKGEIENWKPFLKEMTNNG